MRSVNVEKIKQMFRLQNPKSQFNTYIRNRMVLQWGGLSDGFDFYEKKFRKSLELLRFFREIDYPISISTKGTWFTQDPEYMEAFRDAKNVHVKASIITLDENKAKRIERGVSTPMERFKMLETLAKNGVAATTLRFRPFMLNASADFPFTEKSKQQIDEMVRVAKEHGVYSITAEMLCWESRASTTAKQRIDLIGEITQMPGLFEFYKNNSQSKNGLMRLNYDLKRPYFEAMMEAAEKYGMPAFISDAHHKEKSNAAGCCGLPATGPLSVYNKGQYAEAILIAKRAGMVKWSDISKDAEWLKEIGFETADGFNTGGTEVRAKRMYQTMFDYMHEHWNNPKSVLSPARYFGGALVPTAPDTNGDIVYLYNKPYVETGARVGSVQELQKQLVEQGLAMQADGAQWAHVAFPVVVDATSNPDVEKLIALLESERMNYRLFVPRGAAGFFELGYPNTDVVELVGSNGSNKQAIQNAVAMLGDHKFWLLEPGFERLGKARAVLSDLEQRENELPMMPPGVELRQSVPTNDRLL